jgi:hypothetical protein
MWHTLREEKCISGFVTKPEGKRLLGRPRCRWKNNIKTDVRDTGLDCMDWLNLAEDKFKCWALVNMLTFRCHKIARSFLTSWEPVGFRKELCCMKLLTMYRPSAILGQCKMHCRVFIAFFSISGWNIILKNVIIKLHFWRQHWTYWNGSAFCTYSCSNQTCLAVLLQMVKKMLFSKINQTLFNPLILLCKLSSYIELPRCPGYIDWLFVWEWRVAHVLVQPLIYVGVRFCTF